jgi:YD repeat-containing protein
MTAPGVRLRAYTANANGTITYSYDGEGRRVQKTASTFQTSSSGRRNGSQRSGDNASKQMSRAPTKLRTPMINYLTLPLDLLLRSRRTVHSASK